MRSRVPRSLTAIVLAGALLVGWAGIAGAQSATPTPADEPVKFTVGVTGDLNSANPLNQIDSTESFLTGLMYDGILRILVDLR